MKRFLIIVLILGLLLTGAVGCSGGNADENGEASLDYPKRPVEMVVPFGEGGASDTFARKFADLMTKDMPEPLQPVNKSGSGGLIGMVYAAQQENDGYTLLEITPSHVIADVLNSSEDVKLLEDFEPLARIQQDIYILSVPEESRFESFEEIVEYGQENEVTFAGISPGGLDDMTLNALGDATGINLKFIPYKSGSEVKAAVLGGEVDIYLDKIISAINYIKEGKIKPVLVLNDKKLDQVEELADVPSSVDLGYDVTIGSFRGFVIKKGAPQEVKDYLIEKMYETYETQEYKDFAELNLVNLREGYLGPDEFAEFLQENYEMFDQVAQKVGLK
ncbi:MAG: tripartite tricarboxylate transporter substrate binding protein [Bacillota bacterium]|nr:tripartite tricarboxylate transporter substrate binding protein [Bacillota bacterium]